MIKKILPSSFFFLCLIVVFERTKCEKSAAVAIEIAPLEIIGTMKCDKLRKLSVSRVNCAVKVITVAGEICLDSAVGSGNLLVNCISFSLHFI